LEKKEGESTRNRKPWKEMALKVNFFYGSY